MLVENHSDRIHRWRHANPSGQVVVTTWTPGQVRDIDEPSARQMADTVPEKMRIVSYFHPDEDWKVVEYRPIDPGDPSSQDGPEATGETVPNDSGSDDPSDLLAAANISEAEATASKEKAPKKPRAPRRSRAREVTPNG